MLDRSAWDNVGDVVVADHFFRPDHALIFESIAALAGEAQPCDPVTVSEHLQRLGKLNDAGGLAYLGTLTRDTPGAANVRAYAEIVKERALLRELVSAGGEIAGSVWSEEGESARDLVEKAERRIFAIAEGSSRGKGYVSARQALPALVDQIDDLYNNPNKPRGLPTGFIDFDSKTGGLRGGDLLIVAGRPSMGKTTLAINIAEHAALKEGVRASVAIFSLEMPADQLLTRMLSSVGSVHLGNIRSGKLSEDDWPRITGATKQLQDAKIFIDDTPALTPTELRARARRIKREHGLDLIVVDYLQLMSVPGTKENRATEISEISRGLKALAKEIHCPVIALSQLNRGVEQRENKRPVMSDLRESGAIEQDADMILLIYREEVYNKETPKKGVADIDLAKHRNGETGDIRLTFRGQFAASKTTRIRLTAKESCVDPVDSRADRHRRAASQPRHHPRLRAAREGHGRHQSQCLRTWAGVDGAGAGRCRQLRGGAARRRHGAARRRRACAHRAAGGCVQRRAARRGGASWLRARGPRSAADQTTRGASRRRRFIVWMKIDTGMNRLGFRPEEFTDALARLRALTVPALELRVMTHLARADEIDSPMTRTQLDPFSVGAHRKRGGAGPQRLVTSIGNSAGILGWPNAQGDWVRPGLALYGVSPFGNETAYTHGLKPVMTLETTVLTVRDVKRGETVGYAGAWRAERDSTIAILAAGYGDGLPRILPMARRCLSAARATNSWPRVDGHDRGRCDRRAESRHGQQGHHLGRRVAGGRGGGARRHHSLRVAVRRQPASAARIEMKKAGVFPLRPHFLANGV